MRSEHAISKALRRKTMTAAQKAGRNAAYQAAYRRRHLQDVDAGGERLNMVVGISAKRALERLARHYAVSQQAMLEQLLTGAKRAVADGLEHDAYLRYVQD